MLLIIFAIVIFRYYQNLAVKFNKKAWKYGLMGIAIFLGTQVFVGFLYGMISVLLNPELNDEDLDYSAFSLINIIALISSFIVVYVVRQQLEKKLQKEASQHPIEIYDIGKKDTI